LSLALAAPFLYACSKPNQQVKELDLANPQVVIEMSDGAVMRGELYPEVAPNTVNNFIDLANHGFYDGLLFHRVIPGFMIQGGDPKGNGSGGPGYGIKGEFSGNGYDNSLHHEIGVLSMARAQHADSAGSQFFIMAAAAPHLDGQYAALGRINEGREHIETIVNVRRDAHDRPLNEQRIARIVVDTQGVEYPEPVRIV
jgi:peptidyl-prolyl cis-trans isomerase B (cyclophilin B)